jgi:hypothetical protein
MFIPITLSEMALNAEGVRTMRFWLNPWTTKPPSARSSRKREGTVNRLLSSKEWWN